MKRATEIIHSHDAPLDTVTLSYDDRFRRRIALTGDGGTSFLLDLPDAVELRAGDRLALEGGGTVEVKAADEALMVAMPPKGQLARVAWHIGNRHLPCEIKEDRMVLRFDHVIAEMLETLGCEVAQLNGPFTPEGGAYGHGRTHSHEH